MTYNDVFLREKILSNIPLEGEEALNPFPPSLITSIVLMQVACSKKIEEFENTMQEVLKRLKKDGFDERAQIQERRKEIEKRIFEAENWNGEGEKPEIPSDKEIEEAKEAEKTKAAFEEEYAELDKSYFEARQKKSLEEVKDITLQFTREEYEKLVEVIGLSGTIEFNGFNEAKSRVKKIDFLKIIAEQFSC